MDEWSCEERRTRIARVCLWLKSAPAELSIEIQTRLEVDAILFDDTKLRFMINRAFDWLVEEEFLREIHLN